MSVVVNHGVYRIYPNLGIMIYTRVLSVGHRIGREYSSTTSSILLGLHATQWILQECSLRAHICIALHSKLFPKHNPPYSIHPHQELGISSPCRLHPMLQTPIMLCYLAPYNIIYLCTARSCSDSAIRQSCWPAATSLMWAVWIFVLYSN